MQVRLEFCAFVQAALLDGSTMLNGESKRREVCFSNFFAKKLEKHTSLSPPNACADFTSE